MVQTMLARVTCPSCHNQFQTPIEQILDVRADPSAKVRVFNGLVNVAQCPHCGMSGPLGLPFLYHDPDQELALVHMPLEAGRDEAERQQAIGKLTNAVMNSLPAEERKAYLLQPQVFFTLENLTKKILEADGVTPEMLEEQKAKAEMLRRMLDTTSDEVLEAMIRANDDSIDTAFFQLLSMNLEMAQAAGQANDVQQFLALRDKLLTLSSKGQAIKIQTEMVEELRDQPTREKLVDLLIRAPDGQTRELLVAFGRPLLDYLFFQNLTSQIEAAPDEDEKERLTALRREVLDVRDRLDEQTKILYQARAELLRDLLLSDDPESLARHHAPELDEVLINVLAANLQEAQDAGNEDAVQALQALWSLIMQLREETLPPELRLFNRLMVVEEEEIDKLLQENRQLVTERLVGFMEKTEASAREEGESEMADRMAVALEKMRKMIE
jgi:arsenate reductase-like glutaredoxin family protein